MRTIVFLPFVALLFAPAAHAQQWIQTLGGTGPQWGAAAAMVPGGSSMLVLGNHPTPLIHPSTIHARQRFMFLRLDPLGTVEANILYGCAAGHVIPSAIAAIPDGGAFLVGDGNECGGLGWVEGAVLRVDADGNIRWRRLLTTSGDDYARSVTRTSDGGAIVVGVSGLRMFVAKLSGGGDLLWARELDTGAPPTGGDVPLSVIESNESGAYSYVIAGTLGYSASSGDLFMVELATDGTVQWSQSIDIETSETLRAVSEIPGVGYAAVGTLGDLDAVVISVDQRGALRFPPIRFLNTQLFAVHALAGGGFVAAGSHSEGSSPPEAWMVGFDAAGAVVWHRAYGGVVAPGRLDGVWEVPGGDLFAMGDSFADSHGDLLAMRTGATGDVDTCTIPVRHVIDMDFPPHTVDATTHRTLPSPRIEIWEGTMAHEYELLGDDRLCSVQ